MNKFLRIIFPFYNKERHGFLFGKWWFRMIFIIYPFAILALLIWYFADLMSVYTSCYDTVVNLFDYGTSLYKSEFVRCQERVSEAVLPNIGISVLVTLIIHYLFQLIFFKAFLYVIYGNKK